MPVYLGWLRCDTRALKHGLKLTRNFIQVYLFFTLRLVSFPQRLKRSWSNLTHGFWHGLRMVLIFAWSVHGFCMVFGMVCAWFLAWSVHGFGMVCAWFLAWSVYGFGMVCAWFWHGLCMVLAWSVHGFGMVCACFLACFCMVCALSVHDITTKH